MTCVSILVIVVKLTHLCWCVLLATGIACFLVLHKNPTMDSHLRTRTYLSVLALLRHVCGLLSHIGRQHRHVGIGQGLLLLVGDWLNLGDDTHTGGTERRGKEDHENEIQYEGSTNAYEGVKMSLGKVMIAKQTPGQKRIEEVKRRQHKKMNRQNRGGMDSACMSTAQVLNETALSATTSRIILTLPHHFQHSILNTALTLADTGTRLCYDHSIVLCYAMLTHSAHYLVPSSFL